MQSIGPIDNQIYNQALTQTLCQFCKEDCTQHGRLLALKEILTNLNNGQTLEQLAFLYAKDISVVRQINQITEDSLTQIINNVPQTQEIRKIVTNRAG